MSTNMNVAAEIDGTVGGMHNSGLSKYRFLVSNQSITLLVVTAKSVFYEAAYRDMQSVAVCLSGTENADARCYLNASHVLESIMGVVV